MVPRPLQKLGGDSPLMSIGVRGEVFIEESVVGLTDPRWVRRLGTSAKSSCCTFEPCR